MENVINNLQLILIEFSLFFPFARNVTFLIYQVNEIICYVRPHSVCFHAVPIRG